jgi:peptide/nickel transport system permease protein
MRSLRKNAGAVAGAAILAVFLVLAIGAPLVAPDDPEAQDLRNNFQPPGQGHVLGTDNLGRDIFSRILFGARISFLIGISSVAVGLVAGGTLGLVAGYCGGLTDSVIMRVMDVLLAFPGILLAIAIISILGPGVPNTMLAVGIFSIPTFARIIRASVLSIKVTEFVEAGRALGASNLDLIWRHILPNCLSPVIVESTLRMGTSILTASGLSFLGLGVQPPSPEWGAMLSHARGYLRNAPHLSIAPGMAITLVVLSLSLLGDGLRDALDPRLKE